MVDNSMVHLLVKILSGDQCNDDIRDDNYTDTRKHNRDDLRKQSNSLRIKLVKQFKTVEQSKTSCVCTS